MIRLRKSVSRKRNTYDTAVQRTTKTNKSVTAAKSQDMQDNMEESINLKSAESNDEVMYDTQLKNETSQTKQHSFLKDLWYSFREYFHNDIFNKQFLLFNKQLKRILISVCNMNVFIE